mgnify:CR=1 FL=1
MSEVVVGCDRNDGNDAKVQNAVCDALQKAGHKAWQEANRQMQPQPAPTAAYRTYISAEKSS